MVAIAAGDSHSLALKADGSVVGWGDNHYGQTNIPASAANGVVAIAAGGEHSLALKGDGSVVGWGDNFCGQTNIPDNATNGVMAIAAGDWHSLALKADGSVVGWGANGSGQTNIPSSATSGVVAIAAGDAHSLALKGDGSVVGWGDNTGGQTHIPSGLSTLNLPIAVSGTVNTNTPGSYLLTYSVTNALGGVTTATRTVIVADTLPPILTLLGDNPLIHYEGAAFTDPGATATDLCADDLTGNILTNLTVNASVPGTYTNTFTVTDPGGNTAETNRIVTVVVPLPLVETLPATNLLNGAATLQGSVNPNGMEATAWFEWGALPGYETTTPLVGLGSGKEPVPVQADLSGLTPGVTYHCRLVASNRFWVTRGAERLFCPPALALNEPNPLTNECHTAFVDPGGAVSASPLAIVAGYHHSLALKADGSVVGWGRNDYGQTNIPESATSGVLAIAAGGYHSLALKGKGSVVGWGYNDSGQTNIPDSAASGVVAIAAGGYHSLALKGDGSVVGWGNNGSSQTNIPDSAMSGVVAIAAGHWHSLALKADGSVVGWGYNSYGQTNIPERATSGVVAVAAGGYHNLALKADGSVVGWGANSYGQTNIPPSATSGVVAIAAGYGHSLALKADGSVVGWGSNDSGQTNMPDSAASGVVAIAAGGFHSLALKADGSAVGWGRNTSGQTNIPSGMNMLDLPIAVSGTLDTNTPGAYFLTYSATNALGAVATAPRTVVVADTLPPVLTLLGDNPLTHNLGAPYTDPGATANDLCADDLTGSVVSNLTVNPMVPGTYTNTFTVTDAGGNTAETNRVVTVVGSARPVFGVCSVPAPGQFRLQGIGTAGLTYTLQTSTNLVDWAEHTNVVADPGGLIDWVEEMEPTVPACFYRLSWP